MFQKINTSFTWMFLLVVLSSHDLFIKLDTYFLKVNQPSYINLYNGTFEKSENVITRDRMLDASIIAHDKRISIDSASWNDQDSTITYLKYTPIKEGTYIAGVSTRARNIALVSDKFNAYLEHDGILDMLDFRKSNNLLDQDAIESYQKHVKAIFQVGKKRTNDWNVNLGYPIEFIPLENPYEKNTGDQLKVQLFLQGKPLSDQLIYADHITSTHRHSHARNAHEHIHKDDHHTHSSGQKIRTDANGIATIQLPQDGIYYIRTIHMVSTPNDEKLTHRSKWATLTFEITHEHLPLSIPKWIFFALIIVLLIPIFNIIRKSKKS